MFTCSALSKPQPCNATLYQNSNQLASYPDQTCNGSVTTHMVNNIQGCNAETYSCRVANIAGQCEKTINVTINVPPTISTTSTTPTGETSLQSITLLEGDALTLNCSGTGCPTPSMTWTKPGAALSQAVRTGDHLVLQFGALGKSDAGQYTCTVGNGVAGSPVTNTITVVVNYKPCNTRLTSTKTSACVNDSITLNCTADAHPAPHEYLFYRNDGNLVQSSTSGVLQISPPQAGSDVYTCVPNNTVGTGENKTVQITTKTAPVISFSIPDTNVIEGTSLSLECNATGTSPLNITWTKLGASGTIASSRKHSFSPIARGDEGTYVCTVHNGDECPAATARVVVTVDYKPAVTQLSINKSDGIYIEGESVALHCNASAKPTPCQVLFYQNGALIANYTSSTCSASHVISSVEGCNSENFTCQVSNSAGTGAGVLSIATVLVPPTVSIKSTIPSGDTNSLSLTLVEGDALKLNCTATGCPTPNITWTKLATLLANTTGHELVHQFTSLSKTDTGQYTCRVDNGVAGSPASKMVNLVVQYKPYNTRLTSTNTSACVNNSITLNCTADARPAVHEYLFYRDDNLFQSSTSGVLQLRLSQAGSDVYTCVPNNTVGTGDNTTVQITTKAPPVITYYTPDTTVIEGSNLTLVCNWTKLDASGAINASSKIHALSAITRDYEMNYSCAVRDGDQCRPTYANMFLTVNYKPESTNITSSKTAACLNDTVTLTCMTTSKPAVVTYKFYRNEQHLYTATTGVYTFRLSTHGVNKYTCVPNNTAGVGQNSSVTVTVTAPPVITFYTPDTTVIEGSSLTLVCNWTKLDASGAINASSKIHTLSAITRDYEMNYSCAVRDGDQCRPTYANMFLTVNYKPESTNITSSKTAACLNDTVTLTCMTTAKPAVVTYKFYRNDQHLHTASTGVYTFRLSTHGVNMYTCVPNNTAGVGQNSSVTVTVTDPPVITQSPTNITVVKGSAASLTCNASGTPPLNITWSMPGSSFYRQGAVLTFNPVSRANEGTYQCTVHNGAHCERKSASATVTVNYEASITALRNTNLTEGGTLTLYCNASAKPEAAITWTKTGSPSLTFPTGSPLILSPVTKEHMGEYICNATNSAGTTLSTAHVIIYYAPSIDTPPKNTTVNANDRLILFCNATGHPPPTIYWTKEGDTAVISTRETLDILAKQSSSGVYVCIASNGVGANATASATVQVTANCKDNSCLNGGTCKSVGSGIECVCKKGLTGDQCEIQDSFELQYSGSAKITDTWNSDLAVPSTDAYKRKEKKVIDGLNAAFANEPSFDKSAVERFEKGSVIVYFKLFFKNSTLLSEVKKTLRQAMANGTLGTLKVDPASLRVQAIVSPCSSSPCKYDSTCTNAGNAYKCACSTFRYGTNCENGVGLVPGIVIIVACVAVILIIIILCIWYCCSRRGQRYPKDLEQEGTRMSRLDRADHPNAAVNLATDHNHRSNGAAQPAPTANGQGSEMYKPYDDGNEILYADLAFDDNKPKDIDNNTVTKEKEETTYADITEFTTFKPSEDDTGKLEETDMGTPQETHMRTPQETHHEDVDHEDHLVTANAQAHSDVDHVPDDTDGPAGSASTEQLYPTLKIDLYDIH